MKRTDPQLLEVARGDRPADIVLRGGRVVNVFTREIEDVDVAIVGDRIAGLGSYDGQQIIDLGGAFVAPGFIDAHMHVESTMLLPPEFVRVAAPHGTTGVVLDPHEIANVHGIPGIRLLMDQALGLPMNLFFTASSCVPSAPLETSGANLSAADLAPLFDDDRVIGLAEMMNFPGVVFGDAGVLEKIRLGLDRAMVDGHCPGLGGKQLNAYVSAGISSEHESTTVDEAREKLRRGMHLYIREGSAARNVEALVPLVTPENAHRISFCTDDRHPGDLIEHGHIDHVVRRAISFGLDPITAIAMATLHTADHFRLGDLGGIAPGRHADLIVFESLEDIRPDRVFFHGELIAEAGRFAGVIEPRPIDGSAIPIGTSVKLPDGLDESRLRVDAPGGKIRVIEMDPHQIWTGQRNVEPNVVDGEIEGDTAGDILKMAVIERHRGTGNVGVGFVHGFGLRTGALGSTVGHDAHNLAIVGTNDADMIAAARALEKAGGGQCVVKDGEVLALLELPIAGLISDQPGERVAEVQAGLRAAAAAIGCPHEDPFMPLSFLSLPVIPKLKLTDLGLVDVEKFEVVPLAAE